MNRNEEISNRQKKQDQEALSKKTNMEELETEQISLTEDQFPWKGYTNRQPLRNANLVEPNNNNSRDNSECESQTFKWLEDICKPKNNKSEK
ncbi:hypothetical protein O181_001336 [Austropuccinia psidii MF-1]|uniref:Uncharacterized protein n=1 Tax=Austropuccinia psidii MF-1 TaxID=1389203 RepID=A0A9Q3GCB2_9BASI|nr:hypothetical protein [Austropuccinia psidii MF-1]